jgi:hypothetical protein
VALVIVYLGLNIVVVFARIVEVFTNPVAVGDWWKAISTSHGNPLMVVGIARTPRTTPPDGSRERAGS